MLLSIHKVTGYFTGHEERKDGKGGEHEKAKLILLAGLAIAVSLTGCQKRSKAWRCSRL